MLSKITGKLQCMNAIELNLYLFFGAISWGHKDCRNDSTITAMCHDALLGIGYASYQKVAVLPLLDALTLISKLPQVFL